ncbi:MAG: bifunctional [glutamate--ammonia ligase]-adenylyl-L-tyrosine phosphorylase/[glutamate--ammonia-ligase] adenylyltransferase [Planctomycetes bacterium]|nr:bifunctional [glutamate--ammonia ligase]-adenylyl-L-tyrosine phosphorylase/[glutamate--ammonia-ligase] adenylyltransferase [Planctomycetota bacterium]
MDARDDAIFRMLDLGLPDHLPDEDWRRLGFRDPERVRQGLDRLRTRIDVARVLEVRFADILRALSRSSDPDGAFGGLERWLEAGGAVSGPSPLAWTEEPFLHVLCALFAGTPALSEYLMRFPGRTWAVLQPVLERKVTGGWAWRTHVRGAVLQASSTARPAALRQARTESMLQIAALDLSGVSNLEHTVRALSDLADACIETALEASIENLRPRFGTALPREGVADGEYPAPPPFAIYALGKQGGRELNYSSDIDLIFVFEGNGTTAGLGRAAPLRDYFTRLGEEVIALLDQVTEDGRVYRVDMRLRPYGSVGALALSTDETLAYLQSEGRTWERQAWLKARVAAGDKELGESLLKRAESFIFRRFLSLDAIGDIKNLKKQMEQLVARKGGTGDEVKLGRGGIRDIEFTVQFLQLLHGGQHPEVRTGHTLFALRRLRQQGLLTQFEADRLETAYIFHRQVEHRLQLHGDQQTHMLPADPAVRRRIARSLGYTDGLGEDGQPASAEVVFERDRQHHVKRVRDLFEHLFANLFSEQQGPEAQLSDLLLAPQPEPAEIARLLPYFRYAPSPEAAKELIALGQERLALMNPSRTRKFFASLAPLLLKALAITGDPEGALRRFSRIAHSLGGKAVFYESLHENAWLLRLICDLAAYSEYLTDILVANPGLFDELVDALRIDQTKSLEAFEHDLEALAGGGDIADTLRAYRNGELLRIGVRDLMHSQPLELVQQEISDLAAGVLRAQLRHSQKAFEQKRGLCLRTDGKPVGFAILGVGKFGGREMNYGSDLDVLFFYDADGQTESGLPATNYFGELAQELMRAMAAHTRLGPLYQLDARLRPNGNKGPLAVELAVFEQYWKSGALADWEKLALTRIRKVAGDPRTGERAEHLIRSAVFAPLQSADLAQQVREMRKKIEAHAETDDLKGGRGGLIDIEFLVQFLQLKHGPALPKLRQANTREALGVLQKSRLLTPSDAQPLTEALEFFSLLGNRVRIVHGLSAHTLPQKPEDLQKLALRAGYFDAPDRTAGESLLEEFQRRTVQVREIFERVVV